MLDREGRRRRDARTDALGKASGRGGGPLVASLPLALAGLVFLVACACAGGIRYFSDSGDSTCYPTSWGSHSGGSWVDLVDTSKFPVDPQRPFLGDNSLHLNWISAPGGDWALTAAAPSWSAYDTSPFDSLLFMAWTDTAISASELPAIFLEDQSNVRTPRQALSLFSSGVPAGEWTRISVPVNVFRENPGSADLTNINKVFFGQDPAHSSGTEHALTIDEIRIVEAGSTPPASPQTAATAFERHIDVRWEGGENPGAETMRIEKKPGDTWFKIGDARAEDGGFADWLGAPGETGTYRVTAFGWNLRSSSPNDPAAATTGSLTDDQWLDMVEEAAFRYFWLHAHPVSGLAREVYGSGETCTTGGSGMGVMAIIAAVDRGYITRAEGSARILQILQFLSTNAERYHGAFTHWLNGTTGATIPFNGPDDYSGDIVETSFLIQGFLAARQYFDGPDADEAALCSLATQIWEEVDWEWYRSESPGNVLYWHWAPTNGFSQSIPISGWMEALITYVLAAASPTHPVPSSCYHEGWARDGDMVNGNGFYGYTLPVGPDWGGPLFFAHYSFLGFDPRFYRDDYANYFVQNRNHSLINWTYCSRNPFGYDGYSERIWGLTASYDPWGYLAHAPFSADNGTIAPTAALSSMPYTYSQSMDALKAMYRDYGERLWGPFGYYDAFNPGEDWYSNIYVAIDQGPIAVMIENARSQLLWNLFMSNPEIAAAIDTLGFVPDSSVDVPMEGEARPRFALASPAPNPTRGMVLFTFEIPTSCEVDVDLFDVAGRHVATLARGPHAAGSHRIRWDALAGERRLANGVYFCRLQADGHVATHKVILVR